MRDFQALWYLRGAFWNALGRHDELLEPARQRRSFERLDVSDYFEEIIDERLDAMSYTLLKFYVDASDV